MLVYKNFPETSVEYYRRLTKIGSCRKSGHPSGPIRGSNCEVLLCYNLVMKYVIVPHVCEASVTEVNLKPPGGEYSEVPIV